MGSISNLHYIQTIIPLMFVIAIEIHMAILLKYLDTYKMCTLKMAYMLYMLYICYICI